MYAFKSIEYNNDDGGKPQVIQVSELNSHVLQCNKTLEMTAGSLWCLCESSNSNFNLQIALVL